MVERARGRVGAALKGKWRLDVLLGVGGMAAVYAATHRNGDRVAIKVLHPELGMSSGLRARFLKEGYASNAVGHRGAVRVIDDDVADDGSVFLVMELLDGESLDRRRDRHGGRLSADEVLSIAEQVLDCLACAHERGIVHRDLKPENLFLTRNGVVKVLDFGIARVRDHTRPAGGSGATRTGILLGTPGYMAPEQARGLWDEVDARTDLWAVGAVLLNLLTGRLVHDGRTDQEQLLRAMTATAMPLASFVPDPPPALAALVDRSLAFERSDRWPDARAMQEAVREAYQSLHEAAIETARPLVVPESVPNRTLPLGTIDIEPPSPRLTTGEPVARGRTGAAVTRHGARSVPVVAIAAAIALAGVITLLAAMRRGQEDGTAPRGAGASAVPIERAVVRASGSASASPGSSRPAQASVASATAASLRAEDLPAVPGAPAGRADKTAKPPIAAGAGGDETPPTVDTPPTAGGSARPGGKKAVPPGTTRPPPMETSAPSPPPTASDPAFLDLRR
jgi:serine/threonine-protein kinase